jgi:hypothetical protein
VICLSKDAIIHIQNDLKLLNAIIEHMQTFELAGQDDIRLITAIAQHMQEKVKSINKKASSNVIAFRHRSNN